MNKGRRPFVQAELTENAINYKVEQALDDGRLGGDIHTLGPKVKEYNRQLENESLGEEERKEIQGRKEEVAKKIDAFAVSVGKIKDNIENKKGGCYSGSATFVDAYGQRREMESFYKLGIKCRSLLTTRSAQNQ